MSEPKLPQAYWCNDPSRGTAQGRPDVGVPSGKVKLYKVSLNNQGYDNGGAYWGRLYDLYRAYGEGFEWYTNANSRKDAIFQLRQDFPNVDLARG